MPCCSVTLLVAALDTVDGNDAPRPTAKGMQGTAGKRNVGAHAG